VKSKVAFVRTGGQSQQAVQRAVQRAMELVDWSRGVEPASFFLKVNLLSRQVVPGQCTSPWVFGAVLEQVKERFPRAEIFFGDCEVATSRQVEEAVRRWGLWEIGKRWGATFVNLSRCTTARVEVGPIFGCLEIPRVLLETQALVTIPVVKTHCITPFTGALKNQWGLLPRARFKFHPVVHQAIAEVNGFFAARLLLGVADMTIAMEGPGPRVGRPKVCDLVLASRDLVALDTVAAHYMGFERGEVEFLLHAQQQGLGSMEVEVVGDALARHPFARGRGRDYAVYRWRDRFARTPLLSNFLRQEWFFRPLGWLATGYMRYFWYRKQGREQARRICQTTGYGDEFAPLID
jgi:uncharacterized protein (DUF362 family)